MNNIPKVSPPKLLDDDRKNLLSQLIPESVEDGKINVEKIKESLGEFAEEESANEHFELSWPGKREAKKVAITASKGTLVPAPGEGVDEDKTKNLFIEGENLEVLKLLHKSYIGQIKMIYIDPPYNTGKDFVYSDKFSDSIEEYRRVTGQVDSEGREMETNKKSDGRFHSRWLSMMYPRLKLAKDLLRNDGVIFISIDDNEVHNLKAICNEIFGEENFVSSMNWMSKSGGSADENYIVNEGEYILIYAKDKEIFKAGKQDVDNNAKYKLSDEYVKTRGKYCLKKMDFRMTSEHYTESLNYEIKDPDGNYLWPGGLDHRQDGGWNWRWGKEKMQWGAKEKFIEFKKSGKKWVLNSKQYEFVDNSNKPIKRTLPYRSFISSKIANTTSGSRLISDYFGMKLFEYAKPINLLELLLKIGNPGSSDIILDFFAGSCSTAEAVIRINSFDTNKRKYIMVQMPEKVEIKSEMFKAGYKNIAEISKERIRRAGKKIKDETKAEIDYGFKVFKLQKSNYRDQNEMLQQGQINMDFADLTNPLVKGWKSEDLLTEVTLLEGFPLDSKVEQLLEIKTNKVQIISCDDPNRTYKLFVCLDDKIDPLTISGLTFDDEDKFICLDSAIGDTEKLTLSDKAHLKVI